MGDPAYEERRKNERERHDAETKRASERESAQRLSEEVAVLTFQALKDFIEGRACFITEKIDDVQMRVVFMRG